jgi:hypothetical protein
MIIPFHCPQFLVLRIYYRHEHEQDGDRRTGRGSAARVSLVREVAYPSHRRVDFHSPRRAEELGKEEVDVVPMVKYKTSLGREDQERQEGISGLGNDPLVAVIRSRVLQSGVSPCLERLGDRSLQLHGGRLETHDTRVSQQLARGMA